MTSISSRRTFLRSSIVAAGGLTFSRIAPSLRAETIGGDAAARTRDWLASRRVVVRRNIAEVPADDAGLKLLRDAVKILRDRSAADPLDPRGWASYGLLHSAFCATGDYAEQVHYGWFFLPWHRGYMIALEQLVQEAVNEPQLALFYWDWTTSPQIPRHYSGAGNPLNDPSRIYTPDDVLPWDFLDVGPALRAPKWESFGGYPRINPAEPQIEGCLEQGCHNNTHNWIGGNMASFTGAGYDPMFHTHHGQIDRVWEAWRASAPTHREPTDPRWADKRFFYFDPKGRPFALRVGDMVDTTKVGDRFDSLAFNLRVAALPPYREQPADQLVSAGEIVRTPVALDQATRPQLLAALGNPRARVILQFERNQVPVHPYCVRIFLDRADATLSTDPRDPSYVGTYTYLPIPGDDFGLDRHIVTQLEVTARHAAQIRSGAPLSVALVPLQLRGRLIPPQTLHVRGATLRIDA